MNISNNHLSGLLDEMNIKHEVLTVYGGEMLAFKMYGLDNLVRLGSAIAQVVGNTSLASELARPQVTRFSDDSEAWWLQYKHISAVDWSVAA